MTELGKQLIFWSLVASAGVAVVALEWPSRVDFDSPGRAVSSLVLVLQADDPSEAKPILGAKADKFLTDANGDVDRARIAKFISALSARETLVPSGATSEILVVGLDAWPFPVPLVKDDGAWHFDSRTGEREIIARHIGENEISAIEACKAFVDAEREYGSASHGQVLSYAQRIASTKDSEDGLYWPHKEGVQSSPLGPAFANAEISTSGKSSLQRPLHGYYFRILTAQGPSARDGAYSYLAHGKMIGGFALVAFPARYRASGVMTFTVNQDGVVFQKDMGAETEARAMRMTAYDPSRGWTKA